MDATQPQDDAGEPLKHTACRTIDLGLQGFRECPQVGPNTCKYAVPFGYAFLCCHPDPQDPQRIEAAGVVAT